MTSQVTSSRETDSFYQPSNQPSNQTSQNPTSSYRSVQVVTNQDLKASRLGEIAKKVFYVFILAIAHLVDCLSSIVFCIPLFVSEWNNEDLIQKTEEAKLNAFKKALNVRLTRKNKNGKEDSKTIKEWLALKKGEHHPILIIVEQYENKGKEPQKHILEINDFLNKVLNVKEMIEGEEPTEEIRAAIDRAMETNTYQLLKNENENPAVEFLQVLAIKDVSTPTKNVLKEYGEKVIGPLKQKEYSWEDLANLLDRPIKEKLAFQRNGPISSAIWGITHPLDVVHSIKATLFPLEYNPHESNPNMADSPFHDPNNPSKQMQFYYGPTPTGDRLFNDGVLVYMDKLRKRGILVHELRENFQNTHQKSEAARISEMQKYEKDHPDSMRFISLSFDSEAMKMKTETWVSFETAADFFNNVYTPYVTGDGEEKAYRSIAEPKNDNGIYISYKALPNDQDIEGALTCAKEIFDTLSQNNSYWNSLKNEGKKGKQRLGRMMQVGTHAIISIRAILHSFEEVKNQQEEIQKQCDQQLDQDLTVSRVSGACKQDIDRAIVENIALQLFFRLLIKDTPLTPDEVYSIAGAVIGRARLVEGRLIQWKRYEILSDLLHFVGSQENVEQLATLLKNHLLPQQKP